jgi:AraC-like DNA-binding protein
MSQWVRSESLRGFGQLVTELGGDGKALMLECGIQPDVLHQDGIMISYRKFIALLEAAAQKLGCGDFGMRFSLRQDFSILGPIALAAQQGHLLEDALKRVVSYIHVYSPGISIGVSQLPSKAHFLLTFDILLKPLPMARQANELSIALAMQIIGMLSEGRSRPVKLMLPHGPAGDSILYRRIFKCPVQFHQGVVGIVLNKSDLSLPISQGSGVIGEVAHQYLQSHYLAKEFTLEQKVEALVKPLLMVDQCRNEIIADSLGLHIRQMHRLLQEQGSSYVLIKDRVRKQLAQVYLKQQALSLRQIASLLGYAEQSAFSRSCRRWFDLSPREYRKGLLSES